MSSKLKDDVYIIDKKDSVIKFISTQLILVLLLLIGNSAYARADLVIDGQEQAVESNNKALVDYATAEDDTDFILSIVASHTAPYFITTLSSIQPNLGLLRGAITDVRIRAPPYSS